MKRACAVLLGLVMSCGPELELGADAANEDAQGLDTSIDPGKPVAQGLNGLGELSGLAASTRHAGFYWAHRDGYSSAPETRERLYAFKLVNRQLQPFTGSSGAAPAREFTFAASISIANKNWEDITIGPDVRTGTGSSLYIGDIGNNPPKGQTMGGRNAYQVYQLAEPDPTGASVIPALQATWRWKYPTSSNGLYPNCETMFLLDGNLYIVTKESAPRIFRFPDGFASNPGAVHTLEQVTNGSVTRVVGAVSNPSYGGYSFDRKRFMLGSHEKFHVYSLPANTLRGDAFVKAMLLTAGKTPDTSTVISVNPPSALNTEGGAYEPNTKNIVLGTESKMLFHWPRANIEAP